MHRTQEFSLRQIGLLLAAALVGSLLTLGVSVPAQAAGPNIGVSSATSLGSQGASQSVSVNAAGNRALAIWGAGSGAYIRSSLGTYASEAWTWSASESLDPGKSSGLDEPSVAISPDGSKAVALWQSSGQVWHSNAEIVGGNIVWASSVRLGSTNSFVKPEVKFSEDGTKVFVAWSNQSGGKVTAFVGAYSNGSLEWGDQKDITFSDDTGFFKVSPVSLAVSSDGSSATLVAFDRSGTTCGVKATTTQDSGVTWSTASTLVSGCISSQNPSVAMNSDGTYAVAAWRGVNTREIQVSKLNVADDNWTAPVTWVQSGSGAVFTPKVAIDGAKVAVVWTQEDSSARSLRSSFSPDSATSWTSVAASKSIPSATAITLDISSESGGTNTILASWNSSSPGSLNYAIAGSVSTEVDWGSLKEVSVPNSLGIHAQLASSDNGLAVFSGDPTQVASLAIAQPSSDSSLASLSLAAGSLSPVFDSGVTSYTSTAAGGTTSTQFSFATGNSGASVQFKVGSGSFASLVSATTQVPLSTGANVVTLRVTAESGGTTEYVFTITVPSQNADLSALSVSAGVLDPAFSASTTSYSVDPASAVSTTTVTFTKGNSGANVEYAVGDGAFSALVSASTSIPISAGANVLTIRVTAEDGVTTKSYVVTITSPEPLVAPSAPGTPTGVSAIEGGAVTLTWAAPSTGTTPFTYVVTATPNDGTCTVVGTSATCTGLTNGTPYTFVIAAINAAGNVSSESSAPITPAVLTAPGTPGQPTAVAVDGKVVISPSAPTTGGAVAEYTVTASPGGATCTVTLPVTSCEIAGLINGVAYTFSATALNAAGESAASSPSTAVVLSSSSAGGDQSVVTPGTLDSGFGSGGATNINLANGNTWAQTSGSTYVVAGESLLQLETNGSISSSFGVSGLFTMPAALTGGSIVDILEVNDGVYVLVRHNSAYKIMKLTIGGNLVTGFGTAGVLTPVTQPSVPTYPLMARLVADDSDAGVGIDIGGVTTPEGNTVEVEKIGEDLVVSLLDTSGDPVTGFGTNGSVTEVSTEGTTTIGGAAVDANGNIFVSTTLNNDTVVIAYETDGSPLSTFGVNGIAKLSETSTAGNISVREGFVTVSASNSNETIVWRLLAGTEPTSLGGGGSFEGPLLTGLPSGGQRTVPGDTASLVGERLDSVSHLTIGGLEAEILTASDSLITFRVPAGLAVGTYDLVITSSLGTVTIANAIVITSLAEAIQGTGSTRAWTRGQADGTIKLYAREVIGAGKVQFMVNGREVAWIRAIDGTNPKLNLGPAGALRDGMVRTVTLAPGKNALEIFVDGVRIWRAAYTGR